jgi:hypothetical protein
MRYWRERLFLRVAYVEWRFRFIYLSMRGGGRGRIQFQCNGVRLHRCVPVSFRSRDLHGSLRIAIISDTFPDALDGLTRRPHWIVHTVGSLTPSVPNIVIIPLLPHSTCHDGQSHWTRRLVLPVYLYSSRKHTARVYMIFICNTPRAERVCQ